MLNDWGLGLLSLRTRLVHALTTHTLLELPQCCPLIGEESFYKPFRTRLASASNPYMCCLPLFYGRLPCTTISPLLFFNFLTFPSPLLLRGHWLKPSTIPQSA